MSGRNIRKAACAALQVTNNPRLQPAGALRSISFHWMIDAIHSIATDQIVLIGLPRTSGHAVCISHTLHGVVQFVKKRLARISCDTVFEKEFPFFGALTLFSGPVRPPTPGLDFLRFGHFARDCCL